jgi:hypothetical protein
LRKQAVVPSVTLASTIHNPSFCERLAGFSPVFVGDVVGVRGRHLRSGGGSPILEHLGEFLDEFGFFFGEVLRFPDVLLEVVEFFFPVSKTSINLESPARMAPEGPMVLMWWRPQPVASELET